MRDDLYDQAQNVVDDAVSLTRIHDAAAEGHVVEGDPAGELVAAAKDHDADLIVMGSHGRRGLRRFFLGSVAETSCGRPRPGARRPQRDSAKGRSRAVHGSFTTPPQDRAMRYRSGFLRIVARCLGPLRALGRRQPQLVAVPVRVRNTRRSR